MTEGAWFILIMVISLAVLITISLVFIQKQKYKTIKKQIENLDKTKNIVASTPVLSELSKVESIVKNEKMEEKYKSWQNRFNTIKNDRISQINDLIIEIDLHSKEKLTKNINHKIAKAELELYKAKTSADELLNEIKEITLSEEKYRNIVIKLKAKYRELFNSFNNNKNDYEGIKDVIELQFENIEKRFQDFEIIMENNEYDEVVHIVKALDNMIDHIGIVVDEVPNLVLLAEKLLPKKIELIIETEKEMTEKGFFLGHLDIKSNMEEVSKKVNNIMDRIKVLNLEECMFELKTILDYLDSIFNEFDLEKVAKKEFETTNKEFQSKLKKLNKTVKDIMDQLDDIKNMYDLKEKDIKVMHDINEKLKYLNSDYKLLSVTLSKNEMSYSKLNIEISNLIETLIKLDDEVEISLKSLGSMYDDEQRAREQLDEIQEILNQCKSKIRSYKLPIITNNYFIELSEANEAILEIIKELGKKPIVIKTLNTRVDTARDLVLKLFNTTNDMIKTAKMTEIAIVYGNRYRSTYNSVDLGLSQAENLYYKGNYKGALEVTTNTLNTIEPGISKKIMAFYNK
ncbi:MAG: septation ring formation regulator EzrA [Bacilli bacterium]|nr:septation ring formation regulator EzrA [Bacilli bacterium]